MQGGEKTMGLAVHFPSKTIFANRYQVDAASLLGLGQELF